MGSRAVSPRVDSHSERRNWLAHARGRHPRIVPEGTLSAGPELRGSVGGLKRLEICCHLHGLDTSAAACEVIAGVVKWVRVQ